MSKIDIDVRVTYRVSLSDVEVTEDVAQALVQYAEETLTNLPQCKMESTAFEWVADNIHVDDCYDYESEIEGLKIDGEDYL